MESNTVCDFCGKKKKKVVPYKEKNICNKCLNQETDKFAEKQELISCAEDEENLIKRMNEGK